jgi:hypothetical protein
MDKSDRKGVRCLLWGEPGRSPAGGGFIFGGFGLGQPAACGNRRTTGERQLLVSAESVG